MDPYYDDGHGIQIYHGDCREILPQNSLQVELVLTDPPYVGLKGQVLHNKSGTRSTLGKMSLDSQTVGDIWQADFSWFPSVEACCTKAMLVFCGWQSVCALGQLAPHRQVALITWHKYNAPVAKHNVPRFTTEFCWAFKYGAGVRWNALQTTCFDIPMLQAGCIPSPERILAPTSKKAAHPTQKPLALIHKLLAIGGHSILDPFMGTGTTLEAAKKLGRACIGIELEERYCELAAKRLEQCAVLPLTYAPQPEQLRLA